MQTELSVLACLITGLMSTFHCLGMCGSINTILSIQTDKHDGNWLQYRNALIYNVGRIFSYSIIGLIAGLSSQISIRFIPQGGHSLLQFLSSFILIIIALNILGWFSFFNHLEKISYSVWRLFQQPLRWILPAKSVFEIFCLGLIWGWLPCGMVYSILMLAIVSGNAIDSMLYMLAFGIGTLPGMIMASIGGNALKYGLNKPVFKYFSAILLIVIALLPMTGFWLTGEIDHSHHH